VPERVVRIASNFYNRNLSFKANTLKKEREKKENKDRKDDMGERYVLSNEIISRTSVC